jgi:lysophospholipase L1-like esterase
MSKFSYLALGDSYTTGEAIEPEDSFPLQLKSLAEKKGIVISEPVIIARTGWTSSELIKAIEESKLHSSFGLVTLLTGVNNQYRGEAAEKFRKDLSTLLQMSVQFADGKNKNVVVLSIPDWGVTPYAQSRDRKKISDEIDAFNDINKSESEKAGVRYIDIAPLSRRAQHDLTLLAPDGLHPSAKMYRLWAEKTVEVWP